MRKRQVIAVTLVAACAAAVAGTLAARWSSSRAEPAHPTVAAPESDLVVDANRLHFGEAWETDQFEWTVPVHNRSAAPVRVTTHESSCSCVAATSTTPIAPGATADVTFRIDLRNPCAGAEPQAVRDVAIKVYLGQDSSPTKPLTAIELRGRVRSAVTVGAKSVDLGRIPATAAPRVREVPVRALMALRDLTATAEGDMVQADVKPTGAGTWAVRITSVTGLSPGKHTATIRLHPALASGEVAPDVAIPVEFDVPADVQPDSPTVMLGAHRVGESAAEAVTLTSLSGRPFRVEKWSAEVPADTEVRPKQADGAAQSFTCRQRVAAVGQQSTRITFAGTDADGKPFEVVVAVRYYGLPSP
jgi:hypothetical protein